MTPKKETEGRAGCLLMLIMLILILVVSIIGYQDSPTHDFYKLKERIAAEEGVSFFSIRVYRSDSQNYYYTVVGNSEKKPLDYGWDIVDRYIRNQ